MGFMALDVRFRGMAGISDQQPGTCNNTSGVVYRMKRNDSLDKSMESRNKLTCDAIEAKGCVLAGTD